MDGRRGDRLHAAGSRENVKDCGMKGISGKWGGMRGSVQKSTAGVAGSGDRGFSVLQGRCSSQIA